MATQKIRIRLKGYDHEVVEGAPKAVLEGAKKEDAEAAKEKLEAAGAAVTLK